MNEMMNYNELFTLLGGTILSVPMARVYIDTPYLTSTVVAMYIKEPIYELVVFFVCFCFIYFLFHIHNHTTAHTM